MKKHRWVILLFILGLGAVFFSAMTRRPVLQLAATNLPDDARRLPVHGNILVGQRIDSMSNLSGIAISIQPDAIIEEKAPLILHVRQAQKTTNIRTVTTTIGQARAHPLETPFQLRRDKPVLSDQTSLYFEFETIDYPPAPYDFWLEAPTLSKEAPLFLAYQIDSTKYPDGTLLALQSTRAGDLGFSLYERPRVIVLLSRWLVDPAHRTVWLGLIFIVMGTVGAWRLGKSQSSLIRTPHEFWQTSWSQLSFRRLYPWLIALFGVICIWYWPATNLFHWQDDVFKLARVSQFSGNILELLLTNQPYVSVGNEPNAPIGFYRPISFSLYPWLVWQFFGLSAFWYHALSIIIFGLFATAIMVFSFLILRSYTAAFLAALIWAGHSSKLAAVYWWSSTEDLLAGLFLLITVLLYTKVRAGFRWQTYYLMLATFALAVFSKEPALILLALILPLELFFQKDWYQHLRTHQLKIFAFVGPLLIIAGLYLVIRTMVMHDPTLPVSPMTDQSYQVSLSPAVISRNFLVYAAWSAENWLWQKNSHLTTAAAPLERILQAALARVEASPPFYPGLILIGLYIVALALSWRSLSIRRILLWAGLWWVLMLLPTLLFVATWQHRYLTLSTWSLGLGGAAVLYRLRSSRLFLRKAATVLVSLAVIGYGFWITRLPEKTAPFVTLSAFTEDSLRRLDAERHSLTATSKIYLVGVPPDVRGSVNVYLLRAFLNAPFRQVLYADTPPNMRESGDLVIDMRDRAGTITH